MSMNYDDMANLSHILPRNAILFAANANEGTV